MNLINSQSARDYKREFTGVPNTYKEVFESKNIKIDFTNSK